MENNIIKSDYLKDREAYKGTLNYAKSKARSMWWKCLLYGIMGGAFISLGYVGAYSFKAAAHGQAIGFVMACMIFPVGIIMCTFLGGSLFTSDSLTTLPLLDKEVKIRDVAKALGWGFVGNLIGAFIIALLCFGSGWMDARGKLIAAMIHTYDSKQTIWYRAIPSAMLCNIMVAGSVAMTYRTKTSIAKFFLLWIPIALFVAGGFEHIVANMFVFWNGVFSDGVHWNAADASQHKLIADIVGISTNNFDADLKEFLLHHKDHFTLDPTSHVLTWHANTGRFIYGNLIPVAFGNWVSGAIMLPAPYMIIRAYYKKHPEKLNH